MPRTEEVSSRGAQGVPAASVPYSVLKFEEPTAPHIYRVTLCTSPAYGYRSGALHSGTYRARTEDEAKAQALRHAEKRFTARTFAALEIVRCIPLS